MTGRLVGAALICALAAGMPACGDEAASSGDGATDVGAADESGADASVDDGGGAEDDGTGGSADDGGPESGADGEPESEGESGSVCGPIAIPLAELSTSASFFEYESAEVPGVTVKYFAVMGSDGAPHVAFDACEVCYLARRGYSQRGSSMRCNNCGSEFEIVGIGVENTGTGCWPGYLPITVTDTEVTIQCADLETGARFWE
ncbi:MAG: DUF2318 domain-containing protein [Deltaproteobacteria bacterium]|nr:DUF2318 domain-containing protein [Deltaproteobacteria bacterium]